MFLTESIHLERKNKAKILLKPVLHPKSFTAHVVFDLTHKPWELLNALKMFMVIYHSLLIDKWSAWLGNSAFSNFFKFLRSCFDDR